MIIYDKNNNYLAKVINDTLMINGDVQDDAFIGTIFRYDIRFSQDIKEIGCGSFFGSSIKKAYLPESLKIINARAFDMCSDLKTVVLPAKLEQIGEMAFRGCESLEAFEIPLAVTRIQKSTFENCSSLKSVVLHDEIEYIDERAFYACESLEEIVLPKKLCSLGLMAFAGCNKLKSIIIPPENQNFIIANGVFMTSDKKEIILCLDRSIKSYRVPESVVSIHGQAFSECAMLETFEFNERVDHIAEFMFYACKSLKNITFNNKISCIYNGAFKCCSSLEKIHLPDTTVLLGEEVFEECTSLYSVTFPDNTTIIDECCFADCTSLVTLKLPQRLEGISAALFLRCVSLKEIVIPDSAGYIGTEAFVGCVSLEKITLPDEHNFEYFPVLSFIRGADSFKTIIYKGKTLSIMSDNEGYRELFLKAGEIIAPYLSFRTVIPNIRNKLVEGYCGKDKHGVIFDEEIEKEYTEYIEEAYGRYIKDGVSNDPDLTIFEHPGKFENIARYLMKNSMIKYEDAERFMRSLYKRKNIQLKTEFLEYVRTLDNSDELL